MSGLMTTITKGTLTARQLARAFIAVTGPIPFVRLQALMYLANLKSVRDHGCTITAEPFYADTYGPTLRSVTLDWYTATIARFGSRRLRARCRRWLLQESARKNAKKRVGRINMPGGWGINDACAQAAGLLDAARLRGGWLETWVVTGGLT